MKQLKFATVIILIIITYICSAASYSTPGWVLIWQDEFEGSSIDTSFWGYELGCSGWGNNEWEEYTNSTDNAFIENGNLVIQAIDTGGGNCGVKGHAVSECWGDKCKEPRLIREDGIQHSASPFCQNESAGA